MKRPERLDFWATRTFGEYVETGRLIDCRDNSLYALELEAENKALRERVKRYKKGLEEISKGRFVAHNEEASRNEIMRWADLTLKEGGE